MKDVPFRSKLKMLAILGGVTFCAFFIGAVATLRAFPLEDYLTLAAFGELASIWLVGATTAVALGGPAVQLLDALLPHCSLRYLLGSFATSWLSWALLAGPAFSPERWTSAASWIGSGLAHVGVYVGVGTAVGALYTIAWDSRSQGCRGATAECPNGVVASSDVPAMQRPTLLWKATVMSSLGGVLLAALSVIAMTVFGEAEMSDKLTLGGLGEVVGLLGNGALMTAGLGVPALLVIDRWFGRCSLRYVIGAPITAWLLWAMLAGPLLHPENWDRECAWVGGGIGHVGIYVGLGALTGLAFTLAVWWKERKLEAQARRSGAHDGEKADADRRTRDGQ